MWTNELELRFIEYFHSESILWDSKHQHYKDKNLNCKAWNRIAELMHIPVTDLKKKKESLFASYRKYRKAVKDSSSSGAGGDEVYKPVWFAYAALDSFLHKGLTPKTTTSNSEQPGTSAAVEKMTTANREITERRTQRTGRSRSVQCEVKEVEELVKDALSTFQETFRKRKHQPTSDDCDVYGTMLAKKLRAFSEGERLEIMYEIDGIIINHRRAKHPRMFINSTTSIPSPSSSSQYFQPSPTISVTSSYPELLPSPSETTDSKIGIISNELKSKYSDECDIIS